MSATTGVLCLWGAWFVSWIIAGVWSKRAVSAPRRGAQWLHSTFVYLGFALLVLPTFHLPLGPKLWRLPPAVSWGLVGVVGLGFGVAWWARIHLGRDPDLFPLSARDCDFSITVEHGASGYHRV